MPGGDYCHNHAALAVLVGFDRRLARLKEATFWMLLGALRDALGDGGE
jgi:hypothetical protein